jgi:hypothetical protein
MKNQRQSDRSHHAWQTQQHDCQMIARSGFPPGPAVLFVDFVSLETIARGCESLAQVNSPRRAKRQHLKPPLRLTRNVLVNRSDRENTIEGLDGHLSISRFVLQGRRQRSPRFNDLAAKDTIQVRISAPASNDAARRAEVPVCGGVGWDARRQTAADSRSRHQGAGDGLRAYDNSRPRGQGLTVVLARGRSRVHLTLRQRLSGVL